ncbi:hypothetical protein FJV83_10170 [Mesorhizobium sp. WSM4307]|uniref:hypothetical protein n=1 Tax=unclassified Mesorhizobium TaxID=325217 RepID=UPI00115EC422|nr:MULTISPECIES: hypothetical protein [unclassified Mesorhizobium]TRC72742.1 hypothetical protein FJV81_27035 [Mesorhizobium sp. WSM4315]TRC85274.1 hypothetical protein FJV83_10170 [Mesorhizobium sp. WSM4307]
MVVVDGVWIVTNSGDQGDADVVLNALEGELGEMFTLNKTERITAGVAAALAVLVFFVSMSLRDDHQGISKDGERHYYTPSDYVQTG